MRLFLALVAMLLASITGVFVEHDFKVINLVKVGVNHVAQRPLLAEDDTPCPFCVQCDCDCKNCKCCDACPGKGGVGMCKCKNCDCCKACPGHKKK